ncbi:uncharacterized protein LACBIDRAFT_335934 [Laccaria bicolor S238N-H82]|uniref:Predicted protein n=1 Tax=Laccaria bicolor (strain S238N-H82 / ATCC MYA-4686) TaxID=486041 RepID=B0E3V9_LACBS|nr:uncharacterized protein LACBIDRAFT_335934 [Laccaria bicolor S238N-H82]EDQ98473.1 predicted protein [Laccaria bicolor S238N-H82]|eukprot:XP_001890878.1 predicted protein [Laccaria bicolor S238N-H82]
MVFHGIHMDCSMKFNVDMPAFHMESIGIHMECLRCPHLSIHAFVKAFCDLHGTPFHPYLRKQFPNCFDVYLSIRNCVNRRIEITLKRDDPGWRLCHACPCCTHKLVDEPKLIFDMLITMDGNSNTSNVEKLHLLIQEMEMHLLWESQWMIGGRYDIGCKFRITLGRSPLRCRTQELRYRALVGSFHGHAHNRLCQLLFLATYIKGLGLEDLEGGLIVAKMFELTKMNMSQTASEAHRKCPQGTFTGRKLWSPHDCLCHGMTSLNMHSDVCLKVWAKPASRILMDQHFKLKRAREEILWLNIEILQLGNMRKWTNFFMISLKKKAVQLQSKGLLQTSI